MGKALSDCISDIKLGIQSFLMFRKLLKESLVDALVSFAHAFETIYDSK
jgi:hypothetical protein